jgi:hypothetical protein
MKESRTPGPTEAILTHLLRSCNQVAIINCGTIGPKFIPLKHRKHGITRNMAVANEKKQTPKWLWLMGSWRNRWCEIGDVALFTG